MEKCSRSGKDVQELYLKTTEICIWLCQLDLILMYTSFVATLVIVKEIMDSIFQTAASFVTCCSCLMMWAICLGFFCNYDISQLIEMLDISILTCMYFYVAGNSFPFRLFPGARHHLRVCWDQIPDVFSADSILILQPIIV